MKITLRSPGHDSAALMRSVRRILKEAELWSMATFGPRRTPHVNTAYYSLGDGFDFYFVSDVTTRHIRNLVLSPRVAVAIYNSHQAWDSYHRGMQCFGRCWRANSSESLLAEQAYSARFPAYAKYQKTLTVSDRESSPYRFHLFRPFTLKLLDEAKFGEEVFVPVRVVRQK